MSKPFIFNLNYFKVSLLKNKKEKIYFFLLLSIFLYYIFLAIIFGINTPFALIDDLSDWKSVSILSNFFDYLKNSLILDSTGRFRPIHDLSNAFYYKVWSTQFEIHHIARIFQKVSIYLIGLHTLKLILKNRVDSLFPFLIFTIFFLIHPIAPETRLAPQEITLLFFGSLLLNRFIFYFQQNDLVLEKLGIKKVIFLMILGIFAALSKENGIIFPLWLLAVLLIKNFKNLSKKHNFIFLIYSIIILFFLIKIIITSKTGYLSTDSFSISTLFKKLYRGLAYPLLFQKINPIPILLYLILIRFYWKSLNFKALRAQPFELLNILLLLFIFTLFAIKYPHICPRYFFQNAFLFSLIISPVLNDFFKKIRGRKIRFISITLFSLIFLGNIVNHTYQWTSQYFTRKNEVKLLGKIQEIGSQNRGIYILGDSEYEGKIWIYFNEYLPFIKKEKIDIKYIQKDNLRDVNYVVTREKLDFKNIYNGIDFQYIKDSYPLLGFSNFFFNHFVSKSRYCDCGSPESIIGEEWFIYKVK